MPRWGTVPWELRGAKHCVGLRHRLIANPGCVDISSSRRMRSYTHLSPYPITRKSGFNLPQSPHVAMTTAPAAAGAPRLPSQPTQSLHSTDWTEQLSRGRQASRKGRREREVVGQRLLRTHHSHPKSMHVKSSSSVQSGEFRPRRTGRLFVTLTQTTARQSTCARCRFRQIRAVVGVVSTRQVSSPVSFNPVQPSLTQCPWRGMLLAKVS